MLGMCVIAQALSRFTTERFNLFLDLLNEHSASEMVLVLKLLAPEAVLQSPSHLVILSVGKPWCELAKITMGQQRGSSGCSYGSLCLFNKSGPTRG